MTNRILCVDDEPNILLALARQLRRFEVVTALGPEAGLKAIEENGPFAVVVSDLRMPRMNGVELLTRVKNLCPDTIRIMLTGQGDLSVAAEAVNQGNIFRFLLKPCPTEVLSNALDAGLEQYRLINAEKQLLEQTLRGSVEVMSEILSLANREAFGQAHRMRRYVRHIAVALKLPEPWQYEVAALLSQIGSIGIPPELLDKLKCGEPLNEAERRIYGSRWQVAHDMLVRIPRLDVVAKIVLGQGSAATASSVPTTDPVILGSRMLRVGVGLDELVMAGVPLDSAIAKLKSNKTYDPEMVTVLETMEEGNGQTEICSIRIAQLRVGMVLHADVLARSGVLLLCKGQEVTPSVIARLRGFAASATGVVEPLVVTVRVFVPGGEPVALLGRA